MMIKKLFSAAFGSVSVAAINIITVPILIAALGIEKYGLLSLILSLTLIVYVLTNLQPWQALINFWFKKNVDKTLLVYITFSYELLSCVIGSIIVFLLIYSNYINLSFIGNEKIYISILLSLSILFNFNSLIVGFNRVNEDFKSIAICDFIRALVRLFGALLTVKFNGIIFYILFYMLSNFTASLVGFLLLYKNRYEVHRLNGYKFKCLFVYLKKSYANGFFNYSIFATLKSIIDLPMQHLDKFFVAHYLGVYSVGIYDIAKRICQGFGVVINIFNQVFFPSFVKDIMLGKKEYLIKNVYFYSFIVAFIVSIIGIVFSYNINKISPFVNVSQNDLLFISTFVIFFLVSSSFILVHVLFQALGYIKYDVIGLIIINTIYLLILALTINFLEIYSLLLSYIIQVILVLSYKSYVIKKGPL
ncbi:oligosaccharide flippase family protein [Photobacterium angustum]|uniref:lipopolysaccharide biosynthesis protein n=1 Tax=Photobacterium angustum TaxID=661 RepID=UPI003D1195C3